MSRSVEGVKLSRLIAKLAEGGTGLFAGQSGQVRCPECNVAIAEVPVDLGTMSTKEDVLLQIKHAF